MMGLMRSVLEQRHLVWALLLATLIFGVVSYRSLPVDLFPDTAPPMVNVVTGYPGAVATDVARELSRVLEEEFATLDEVVKIRSNSEDGLSVIRIEFDYGRDSELAAMDVQNGIGRVADRLPVGAREPQVLSVDGAGGPVMTFGVIGADLAQARRYAEDVLEPQLQRVEGVGAVDVFGGLRDAVVVELDVEKLEAVGLTLEAVRGALAQEHVTAPAGKVETSERRMLFRVDARRESPEALAEIAIGLPDGSRVLLGDLGEVRLDHLDEEADFAVDGQPAVAMQVFKAEDANPVEVVHRAEALMASMEGGWKRASGASGASEAARIVVGDESASFTKTSIGNLFSNVFQAIVLAALLIFLFLGRPGASLVAAVSMPLSYGLTFIGMRLWGIEFHMVTLSAVILAVGMVVDASVVVLENIVRFRDEGAEAAEAAARGTADVALAVLGGAATTVAVLIPLLFVDGFVGAIFGSLAQTLLLAFLSSLFVALVIVPPLSLWIRKAPETASRSERLTWPFRRMMDGARSVTTGVLRRAFRHRALSLLLAVASFAVGMAGMRSRGMEVLPKMDGGSFSITFETPSGSSLGATNRVSEEIEALLSREPEVVRVQRQNGFEPGMRTFSATGAQGPTQGALTVKLSPRTEREESIWEIQDRVREGMARIGGIEAVVVREMGNTAKSTTEAPVGIRLSGSDPLVLDRLGEEVLAMLGEVEGVVSPVRTWRIDQATKKVEVDMLRAAQMGTSAGAIAAMMQAGTEGVRGGEFYGARPTSVPILLRYGQRETMEEVLNMPVRVGAESVPLRALVRVREEVGPALVTRENLQETLDITAQTSGRPLNFIVGDVAEVMEGLVLPQGYEVELSGERSDLDEARGGLGKALLMAMGSVYLILLIQLRSFLLPLVIMMSVPLSLVGVSTSLGLAGEPVSMPVMVGLILLVGIVVNNAIILLDVVHRFREEGKSRQEALLAAVTMRFRPIMMTSMSTVVGMIPLAGAWALGAERFAPLGIALMGGMIASTLLTLIVVPVLYDVIDGFSERFGAENE